ncbi:Vacuolar protein sorting-associated protein 8-like [Hondaea fermentalgiana]|uniref:Vacuolar protein sorting-associated protein 8-like n=1 Tax=Hondaea fermentalgiana TaxID=2315210 RepID=A0A2R5G109_9STRA|nr:Vacuolar protein sorting-associated protein 8-like [Hondaea fermentalgiana]|eukprot:GBG24707.1 Vacuolar protein sorting-associated protein 8-like [Hondaea fermentalgiana]
MQRQHSALEDLLLEASSGEEDAADLASAASGAASDDLAATASPAAAASTTSPPLLAGNAAAGAVAESDEYRAGTPGLEAAATTAHAGKVKDEDEAGQNENAPRPRRLAPPPTVEDLLAESDDDAAEDMSGGDIDALLAEDDEDDHDKDVLGDIRSSSNNDDKGKEEISSQELNGVKGDGVEVLGNNNNENEEDDASGDVPPSTAAKQDGDSGSISSVAQDKTHSPHTARKTEHETLDSGQKGHDENVRNVKDDMQDSSSSRSASAASKRIQRLTSYTNVGNREISAPLHEIRAKFRARTEANFASAKGIDANVQFAQVVSLDVMDNITADLERNAQFEQHGPGLPTSIAVLGSNIIIGTSRSLMLVFDAEQRCTRVLCGGRPFDKLEAALRFSLTSDANHGPVSSIDAAVSGANSHNLLAVGFARGRVEIWDLTRFALLRHVAEASGPSAHSCAICSVRFVGTGGPKSNRFDLGSGSAAPRKPYATIVSADTSGVVNMSIVSKTLMMFSLETKCLLDGAAGQIVSMAAIETLNLVAITSSRDTFVVSLDNNTAKIVHRWPVAAGQEAAQKEAAANGILPRLSWGHARLADDFSRQKSPHILARAEGNIVRFLRCDVAIDRKSRKRHQRVDLSRETYQDKAAQSFVALEWLSETLLALLTSDYDLCILDVSGMAVVERTSVRNVELVWTAFSARDFSFQNSVRANGSELYLLGIRQLSLASVQSWMQRVEVLIAHNGWLEALALALDHYQLTNHRDTGQLVDLVMRFVSTAAGTPVLGDPQSVAACIEFCVEIEKTDFLFDTVYNVFVQCGQQSVFLRLMEPYILNRLLTVVRPSVLQDFVHEYMQKDQADRLEQCILHLTPDTIRTDLHTLVSVCKANGLLSGLVYLYTAGLNDFETPARSLLEMGEVERLLAYMETSFHGLSYPFGFPMEPGATAFVRVTLLGFLIENIKPMARALVLNDKDVTDLFALCRAGLGPTQDEWELRVVEAVRTLDMSEAVALCSDRLLEHSVPGLRDADLVDQVLQRIILDTKNQGELVQVLKHCNGDLYDVERLTEQLRAFGWNRALRTLHENALEAAIADGQNPARIQSVYEQIIRVSETPAAFIHSQLLRYHDALVVREALEEAVKANLASLLANGDERDLAAQVIVRVVARARELDAFPELQFLHMKNAYLTSSLGIDPGSSGSYGFDEGLEDTAAREASVVRFVELLCRFEPDEVLRFVRDRDGLFPLDTVLEICKEHKVRDAAAFLLERTGDTTGALHTILASLGDADVHASLESTRAVALAAVQLCERNSLTDLDEHNAERLWFALLDAVAKLPETSAAQASNNTAVLRQVLDAMMTRVESETILSNIKADSFGQIRHTVKCMVDARVYEKQILIAARSLASKDLVNLVRAKHGTLAKASTRVYTRRGVGTGGTRDKRSAVWSASSRARATQPSWDQQISDLLPSKLKIDPD